MSRLFKKTNVNITIINLWENHKIKKIGIFSWILWISFKTIKKESFRIKFIDLIEKLGEDMNNFCEIDNCHF